MGGGTSAIVIGLVIGLVAFYFAVSMTRGRPIGRIAALIAAVSVSILAGAIVYALTRGVGGEPAQPANQTQTRPR